MKYLVLLLFFLPLVVFSQNDDKTAKDGFAIQFGMGPLYGGNGVAVEFQILAKEKLRITPNVGCGTSIGGTDSTDINYYWFGYSLGVNVEYGERHRFIFGPQIIGAYNVSNKPADAKPDKKTIYGPSFIAGYKGTASFGLIWQVALGMSYLQDPLSESKTYNPDPHISFGLGYKF